MHRKITAAILYKIRKMFISEINRIDELDWAENVSATLEDFEQLTVNDSYNMLDATSIKDHLPDREICEEDFVNETVYNLINHIQTSNLDPESILEAI